LSPYANNYIASPSVASLITVVVTIDESLSNDGAGLAVCFDQLICDGQVVDQPDLSRLPR
jgi:hypothetical protein